MGSAHRVANDYSEVKPRCMATAALLHARQRSGGARLWERLLGVLGEEGVEFVELRLDDARLGELVDDDFLSLEAVAGDADDDRLVAGDAAGLDELDRGGERGAARGFGPD